VKDAVNGLPDINFDDLIALWELESQVFWQLGGLTLVFPEESPIILCAT
jgi:hypothetical protein